MPYKPIYYDTETTGVKPERDRIIEIAAYDPISNRTFVEFVHPGCPIPEEVSAITSITDDMVASASPFSVIGARFIEFCGQDAILIAHNNERFDKLFLEHESSRCGLTLPSWKYIDTLKWSRKYRNDLPGHSLQSLREVYGIVANQAHRALSDVQTLYQVFSLMIDDLPIETVLALSSLPGEVTRMPFGKYQGRPLTEVPSDYIDWLKRSGSLDKGENKELKEALLKLTRIQNT